MSVIRLFSENPTDGVSSFNQTRFYEADDSIGTNSTLIATVNMDLAALSPLSPGFTAVNYPSGSNTKYYASSWFNSTSSAETAKSQWVQGGIDRWDTRFLNELADTTNAVWSPTDLSYFKDSAVEALYPEFFLETIDTSLSVVNNQTTQTREYTLPFGVFHISEVGIGNPNNQATYPFTVVKAANWQFEKNKLRFLSLAGLSDGFPIRLVCHKKYTSVGEIPQRLDQVALLHMRMDAYLNLADDYPRFLQWGKLQEGSKVSFENLRVHAREYERKFDKEKARLADLFRVENL